MISIRLSSLLALALLAGCAAPQVRTVPATLPLPAQPVLAPVTSDAVQCLAPGTYTTLVERERALRTWGQQMQAIIQANNKAAGAK